MKIVRRIKINIFYLDHDPRLCAEYHEDRHTVKMILEYAQLLSTAHRLLDNMPNELLYKATHKNHPCAKWVRENKQNYKFVYCLLYNLCNEYSKRYGKMHKTFSSGIVSLLGVYPDKFEGGNSPVPICMPNQYKIEEDPIKSYRNYYNLEKSKFAKWKNGNTPFWFNPLTEN